MVPQHIDVYPALAVFPASRNSRKGVMQPETASVLLLERVKLFSTQDILKSPVCIYDPDLGGPVILVLQNSSKYL